MRITEWLTPANPCRQYNDNEQLFLALKSLNNSAILCIQTKALPSAHKLVQQYGLPPENVDELVNESTLIFLRKISDGAYQFQGHAPSSYLIEIMKRVALTMTRKKQKTYEALEDHHDMHDPDLESSKRQQESADLVRQFLGQMGEPCASVIRLHHIEGYSDDEVVRQGWTRYSTTDSLKIKRSDCMKKLIQIAQKWRTSNHT
jgi:RNA polymerase sigma factor (sigma-70 family)